jgi:restriction endonuclease S subunit
MYNLQNGEIDFEKLRMIFPSTAGHVNKFLLLPFARNYFSNVCKISNGQAPVNQGQVLNLCISFLSMREQKVIVTKVEKLLALYDQMEEQITKNQAHGEQLMQAILKEAFSHNSIFQTTATTLVDADA